MNRSTQHAFEPEEIMAYLDGELEARQAAALASHLEHCGECQTVAAQLRQVSERLLDFNVGSLPGEASSDVLAALETDSAARRTHPDQRSTGPWKALFIVRRPYAWAGVCLIAVLAFLAWSGGSRYQMTFDRAKRAVQQQQSDIAEATRRESNSTVYEPSAPPPPKTPASRRFSSRLALTPPGTATLGDLGANSLSVNGQPLSDVQSKILSNQPGSEFRGPMIVQTASITILASNYDQARTAIERVTGQHSGYVQDITANSQTGSARSLSGTLRVPEQQLEAFLADLRKLGHLEQETHNNQEITAQYIDLTARLKASRATEQRILDLLKTRTGNLGEVLQAEQELARVRGDIESMDGQRAHMEHEVRYATVQVQLNEEYREQLNPESFSTGRRLRNSLVEGLGNLAAGITATAIFVFAYGPSILFWLGVIAIPAWFIWRRFRGAPKKTSDQAV
jgi:anti-sigma factor RsiW